MRLRNTQLAGAAKDAGVIEPRDYAIFQNHGYMGLYAGLDAQDIHARKGLKKGEQILDHMGSTELAANLFRATQAEDKLRREKITGKAKANQAHREVGAKVRQAKRHVVYAAPGVHPQPAAALEEVASIPMGKSPMLVITSISCSRQSSKAPSATTLAKESSRHYFFSRSRISVRSSSLLVGPVAAG